MSYSCPRCGSENVQKLSLTHGAGTTGFSATTLSTGLGRGHGGIGIAATHGQAQSLLAGRFAPPKPESAAGSIGCFAILGFAVAMGVGAALDSPIAFWVIMGLTVALGVAFARQVAAHNAEQLPKAKALWDRRFICLRCEEVFEPQTASGSGSAALRAGPQEAQAGAPAAGGAAVASEGYTVRLLSGGERPLAATKIVRDLLGLRILEAKQLVETAPQVIRSGLSLAEAEGIRAQFEAIGASADIVRALPPAPVGAAETPVGAERPSREDTPIAPSPATRRCPSCGRPIHRLDGSCVHCQAEEAEDRSVPAWLWAGIALLLIAGAVAYFSLGRSTPAPTQVQAQPPVRAAAAVPQTAPPARTLAPEITVQAGLLGPFEISGTTNLPEGTLLPIWLEGDYPACTPNCGFEMEQTAVRNGRFQTTVKGQDPPPGRYTVHVTTAMASVQSSSVGAIFGPSGKNLRGAYIAVLSDDGKYLPIDPERADVRRYLSGFLVHYTQRIEIDEGGEVSICPKRGTADDCEVPGQTSGAGSEAADEVSQVGPADPAR